MQTTTLDLVGALADGMLADWRLLLTYQTAVWAAQVRYWLSLTERQRFRHDHRPHSDQALIYRIICYISMKQGIRGGIDIQ